jgi:hypothetical protein
MAESRSLNYSKFVDVSGSSSLIMLLECGLDYVQQGRYAEGAVVLAQARKQLSCEQIHLIDLIDVLLGDYADYQRIQQALQDAHCAASLRQHGTGGNIIGANGSADGTWRGARPCDGVNPSVRNIYTFCCMKRCSEPRVSPQSSPCGCWVPTRVPVTDCWLPRWYSPDRAY